MAIRSMCNSHLVSMLPALMLAMSVLLVSQTTANEPEPSALSDNSLTRKLDSARSEYRKMLDDYMQTKKHLEELSDKKNHNNTSVTGSQIAEAVAAHNLKAQQLQMQEVWLQGLEREANIRKNTPPDIRSFERLEKRLDDYRRGRVTRDEMVQKYRTFVAQFPNSPKVSQALFNAACLYTQWRTRDTGTEKYEPRSARDLYEEIVKRSPDLFTPYVLWSRQELASLYPTADERFQNRLQFYKWLQKIDQEDYDATLQAMKQERRFQGTDETELRERIDGLVNATVHSVERNVVIDAKCSSHPIKNLDLLITMLPESHLSEMATEERRKFIQEEYHDPMEPLIKESLEHLEEYNAPAKSLKNGDLHGSGSSESADFLQNRLPETENTDQTSSSEASSRTTIRPMFWGGITIIVVSAIIGAFFYRKKEKQRS